MFFLHMAPLGASHIRLPPTETPFKCFSSYSAYNSGLVVSSVITSLAKGGYVFTSVGLSVGPSVCLFVDNVTQNFMNGLG